MKGLFVEEKFKMYMKEFPEVTDKPEYAELMFTLFREIMPIRSIRWLSDMKQ